MVLEVEVDEHGHEVEVDEHGQLGGAKVTAAAEEEAVDQPVNEVQIAVLRARRLPAVDKSLLGRASSDPQVVSHI